MGSQTRIRKKAIKVWVTEEEKEAIEANARSTRLSNSSYLRNLGLGFEPASTLDHESVLKLLKVNADLGRLGGLLKMWLSNDERFSLYEVSISKINALFNKVEETQAKIQKIVLKL